MLSNQSIKIRIWFIIQQNSTVTSIRFIQQIVQFNWSFFYLFICSTYFFDNCTNQYLFTRQLFQRLHEYFTHYNSKKILKYTNLQIKLTCSFQFRSKQFIDSFVRINIYLSFVRQFFSEIARASFSLQFEIFDQNIRVCKSNRRVFSVLDRECTSWICIENFHSKQFSIRSSWIFLRNFRRKQFSFHRENVEIQTHTKKN